jgi:hypothetical protein
VKHATKLGYALRELEEFRREIPENWTISVTIPREVWTTFPLIWYLNMLTELDNLQQKREDKREEDNMFNQFWTDLPASFISVLPPSGEYSCNTAPVQEKKMLRHCDDDDFDFDRSVSKTEAERTREFFLNDLEVVETNKRDELRKRHGMEDADSPRTFEDFMDRITQGKWALRPERNNQINIPNSFSSYNIENWIRWRNDGKLEEDRIGFDKAETALEKASASAERQIRVAELKDLPKIVEEFENTPFH